MGEKTDEQRGDAGENAVVWPKAVARGAETRRNLGIVPSGPRLHEAIGLYLRIAD